jgi:hypothetical protein
MSFDLKRFFHEAARRPWFVISAMGHVLILAVVSVVVFSSETAKEETTVTQVNVRDDQKEPEPEVKPPEVVDREEKPKLQDTEIKPNDLQEWMDEKEPEQAMPEEVSEMPVGDTTGGTAIGIAGPGHHGLAPSPFGGKKLGGKYGSRFGTGDGKGRPGGQQTAEAVRDGLIWLKNHQDQDGHWDTANFMKHDKEGPPCDGAGNPVNDIGITGLALLAFLGEGNTMRQGHYRDVVRRSVKWLVDQQDTDGLIGMKTSHEFMYSHSIAALALCEAYGLSDYKPLKAPAQKAINYLQNARNPYKVWRYYPQDGDNDTSLTGWMVLALASAKEFKLTVDENALKYSQLWFDEVTDPVTGQAGYTKRGEGSSRREGMQDKFPSTKTEALTGVVLLCRFFLGEDPKTQPLMNLAADTILKKPPVWDPNAGTIDMYYWYYASFAMFQMGGARWDAWNKKMTDATVKSQRKDGNFKGSWDPIDPWGQDGGRVYATAIMVLCLEVYYRYSKILGGR